MLQGKCSKVNSITFIPVISDQPLATSISFIAKVSPKSTKELDVIRQSASTNERIIGKTISFAGIPKIKAVRIYPV